MKRTALQRKLNIIIFGHDTPSGKTFDLVLIWLIVISVLLVMLETVSWIEQEWGEWLIMIEWGFTVVFTLEYLVRIYVTERRWAYIRSFYGIVDLLSILPTYLGLFFTDARYLLIVRVLRVLRVFRVLKLVQYMSEANILVRSMKMSRRKIFVFFSTVLVLSTIFGSLMYIVEGPEHGFTSIPKSIYWTIVTITTVGYGDITPHTVMGQFIASAAMLTGYSIIAVPTGILTAELASEMQKERTQIVCPNCHHAGHESDAFHCKHCGSDLGRRS
ncbi:MAG: ion transporter [Candidatus Pelagadaptatus aseana]|uniref:ion transporter n=1 Tax=Candidatus Pelagadaptatus aseana TaxID=3120508 RepID=UPI0039B1DB3E